MNRRLVWVQLLIGWFPLWGLLAVLIATAHHVSMLGASHIAFRMIVAAALLAFLVQRFAERYPWPSPIRPGFVATHILAAVVYSILWIGANSLFESVLRGQVVLVVGVGVVSSFTMGMWLYVMISGVSYTALATERAARAEASSAKAQLAALRSQIHPHFLFNALHTVMHLIPREPARAADATEQLAGLLRTAVEEDRDLVTVEEEFQFVMRYWEIERIRFGDRLTGTHRIDANATSALIPAFAMQTLVENAIRHAVTPRVERTTVDIDAVIRGATLDVIVRDSGGGQVPASTNGTGLNRLRERLQVLYGDKASLDVRSDTQGVIATLTIPQASE
ncbi:MAG TPA: histidine kinase [Gemmatimonadaceae bacterium]|nr:histidine kinase [Gemmatimonadaceae bacterium]